MHEALHPPWSLQHSPGYPAGDVATRTAQSRRQKLNGESWRADAIIPIARRARRAAWGPSDHPVATTTDGTVHRTPPAEPDPDPVRGLAHRLRDHETRARRPGPDGRR